MKTLGSIRVKAETITRMESAIKKHNQKSLVPISTSEFRRLAIELLAQLILQDKPLPIKLQSDEL